jgi:hypothetical protein
MYPLRKMQEAVDGSALLVKEENTIKNVAL